MKTEATVPGRYAIVTSWHWREAGAPLSLVMARRPDLLSAIAVAQELAIACHAGVQAEAPHLHFAILQLGPEKHWWVGFPINPYPYLLGSR